MVLVGSEMERVAKRILADYDEGRANEIFGERGTGWLTLDDAYGVQKAVAELRVARGEKLAGYKVGCLSPTIQKQLGLQEPVRGYIWKSEMLDSGSRLSCAPSSTSGKRFVNLAIEGEIALRLARDVSPEMDEGTLAGCVGGWFPVIELHNYVFRGAEPTSQELVAGNAMQAGFVAARGPALPLRELTDQTEIEVRINDELVEKKRVGEIPGGPLGSARWVASSLTRAGEILRAGEIVLTGSPGRLIPLAGPAGIVVVCVGQRVELILD